VWSEAGKEHFSGQQEQGAAQQDCHDGHQSRYLAHSSEDLGDEQVARQTGSDTLSATRHATKPAMVEPITGTMSRIQRAEHDLASAEQAGEQTRGTPLRICCGRCCHRSNASVSPGSRHSIRGPLSGCQAGRAVLACPMIDFRARIRRVT
jgi:hypothetical protein